MFSLMLDTFSFTILYALFHDCSISLLIIATFIKVRLNDFYGQTNNYKKCDNTHNKSKDDNSKVLKNIIKKDSQAYIGVKMS